MSSVVNYIFMFKSIGHLEEKKTKPICQKCQFLFKKSSSQLLQIYYSLACQINQKSLKKTIKHTFLKDYLCLNNSSGYFK